MLLQFECSPRERLEPLCLPSRIKVEVARKALERDRDFLARFAYLEPIKAELRRRYAFGVRQAHRATGGFGERAHTFRSRSVAFWAEYEELNRRYIPDDPVYSKAQTGVGASTTNSAWQTLAAAAGQMRILESFVGGEATASGVQRFSLARSAAGAGTAPTTYTPEKFNTRSPAAATTVYGAINANVAWGTSQETLGNTLIVHAFNAFGGTSPWVAQPGEEIYFVNGEYASCRASTGTNTCSLHVIFEEL